MATSSKKKLTTHVHNTKAQPDSKKAARAPREKRTATREKREKTEKLSPVARALTSGASLVRKVDSLRRITAHWNPDIEAAIRMAVGAVGDLVETYKNLPEGFDPPSRVRTGGLAAGDVVEITDRARERYVDILEESEFANLTVLRVAAGKVRVRTAGGDSLMFPRGHVAPTRMSAMADDDGDEDELTLAARVDEEEDANVEYEDEQEEEA